MFPPGVFFHLSHLGLEFRVLCFLTSVPNRVWVSMGPPCLTYLASYILVVARADLHLQLVCVLVGSQVVSKPNQGQEDIVSWLAHFVRLRTGLIRELTGYPNLRQTVETDSRVWPAFELGVDSAGPPGVCVVS